MFCIERTYPTKELTKEQQEQEDYKNSNGKKK